MSIMDVDWGPLPGQTPAQGLIRAEIGRYFGALMRIDLDVRVVDYVIGFAASWAENILPNPALPVRLRAVEIAKRWIEGYLEWFDQTHTVVRTLTAAQPDNNLLIRNGCVMDAKRAYRNILWTSVMMESPRCLYNCPAVTDAMLERVNMNMMGERIDRWLTIWFGGVQVDLPDRVTKGGSTLTLGVEILNDWLAPPDAGHGHPMTTIRQLKAFSGPNTLRRDRDNSGTRKSHSILHAGEWILVLDGADGNTIITFYKKHV